MAMRASAFPAATTFASKCWSRTLEPAHDLRTMGMNGWVKVGTRGELLPGEFRVVWDGDTSIAVYNIDGALYAIQDVCTHDGGELDGGPGVGFGVARVR